MDKDVVAVKQRGQVLAILLVPLLCMIFGIGCGHKEAGGPILPKTADALAISLTPERNSSVIVVVLKNISSKRVAISWDRWSRKRLLGHFTFRFETLARYHPHLTASAAQYYRPEKQMGWFEARESEGADLKLQPGEIQSFEFNLARIYSLDPSTVYLVSASYQPDQIRSNGSITSGTARVEFTVPSSQAALIFSSALDGCPYTCTEN